MLRDVKFQHFRWVDALRGWAVLGVIYCHCGLQFPAGVAAWPTVGARGVQLFFLLSAFTIFRSIELRSRENRATLLFMIRRFFRIAPMFYVAIIMRLALEGYGSRDNFHSDINPTDLALGILFLNGWKADAINTIAFGGWTVAVEMTFYWLVPILHHLSKNLSRILIAILLAGPVTFLGSWHLVRFDRLHVEYYTRQWFPVYLPVFLFGILLFMLWKRSVDKSDIPSTKRKLVSTILTTISILMLVTYPPFTYTPMFAGMYWATLAFAPLILGQSLYPWKIIVNRATCFLGRISYSFYLLHPFAIMFLYYCGYRSSNWFSFCGAVTVATMMTIPFAHMSYRFIERPCIELGQKFISNYFSRSAPRTRTTTFLPKRASMMRPLRLRLWR